MTPRCTNCNDTGWLLVGRVPERCGECQMAESGEVDWKGDAEFWRRMNSEAVACWRKSRDALDDVAAQRDALRARADRLTLAAQAARDALEPFADAGTRETFSSRLIPFAAFSRAREALASLASVLGGPE